MRWAVLVLLPLIAAIGCEDLPTRESTEVPDVPELGPQRVLGPGDLVKFWENAASINIAVDAGSFQSLIEGAASSAASNWNNEVLENFSPLPHFDNVGNLTLSKPRIVITYDDSEWSGGPNFGYCGSTAPGTGTGQNQEREITIYRKDDSDSCGGRIVDDLAGVIAHEFSEALGIESPGNAQTLWCVANVQDTGQVLNKEPCAWEQQLLYHGYGVREGEADPPQFESPITRSIYLQNVGTVDTVTTADTVVYKVRAYSGPEPSQPFPRDSAAVDDPVTTWIVSSSSVLTIISQTDTTVTVTGGSATGESYLIIALDPDRNAVYPWPRDSILIRNPSTVTSDFCVESTSTWRYTDQYLNAACGETGSNIRYRWRFEAGGPWTAYSADTLMEFLGHSSSGMKTVTLSTNNLTTGDTALKSRAFSVNDNILSMSGPATIPVKTVYTYESSGSPCWYDRYPPNYTWLSLQACQDSSIRSSCA